MIPINNLDGCGEFTINDFDEWPNNNNNRFFILVNRGGCSFSNKIRSASKLGASVIIVSDFDKHNKTETKQLPEKDNDGSLEIHIPLFEISFRDA